MHSAWSLSSELSDGQLLPAEQLRWPSPGSALLTACCRFWLSGVSGVWAGGHCRCTAQNHGTSLARIGCGRGGQIRTSGALPPPLHYKAKGVTQYIQIWQHKTQVVAIRDCHSQIGIPEKSFSQFQEDYLKRMKLLVRIFIRDAKVGTISPPTSGKMTLSQRSKLIEILNELIREQLKLWHWFLSHFIIQWALDQFLLAHTANQKVQPKRKLSKCPISLL